MMMELLPQPLASPLHIFPPWLLFLAGLIALYLLYRLLDRYGTALINWMDGIFAERKAFVEEKQEGEKSTAACIRDILYRYKKERGNYRLGLFELSGVMKTHFERLVDAPIEEMTADEIARLFLQDDSGRFFCNLEETLYAEREPKYDDLKLFCDDAGRIVKQRVPVRKRR